MADVDAGQVEAGTVRLQVAAARQEESGRGIARMPRSAFQALGITEGDAVEIQGKRMTAALAIPAFEEDESLMVIRLDGLQRANAETASGEHVTIRRAHSRAATRVVFAPARREMRLQGPTEALKRVFFKKPLTAGDLVATHGQQPVQNVPPEVRRMFNAPAYALTQIRLQVVSTTPKGIVHIDENTEVELRAAFEEPRDGRGTVNYDDVGGMEETIKALREMVELPLRYPELFTRLGVDPPRACCCTGPPALARPASPRRWRTKAMPSSSPSTGPKSWAAPMARARSACARCSTRPSVASRRSCSSTRSTPSRPSGRTCRARRKSAW